MRWGRNNFFQSLEKKTPPPLTQVVEGVDGAFRFTDKVWDGMKEFISVMGKYISITVSNVKITSSGLQGIELQIEVHLSRKETTP
jgi:hypothetical protein